MRIPALAVIGLSCLLAGCHSGSHTTQFGGTTVTRNDAGGTTTITNKAGSVSTVSGVAAQAIALPIYAPRYPGATIVSVLKTSNQKGRAQNVRMDTLNPAAPIMPFYRHALTSNGGRIDMDMSLPTGGGMLSGSADGRKISITVDPEDGKTAIVVSIAQDTL